MKAEDAVSVLQEAANVAVTFIRNRIDDIAADFQYEFIDDKALVERLCQFFKRMLDAKLGFLYQDKEHAFEEFSRNALLQMEGLINSWYKEFYLKNNTFDEINQEFVIFKMKQYFTRPNTISSYEELINEITKISTINEIGFAIDYINLSNSFSKTMSDKFYDKYQLIFDKLGINYVEFRSKVFKFTTHDIEKVNFDNKADLFFHKKGSFYVGTVAQRLVEFRNSLSHAKTINRSEKYYTELVGIENRFNLISKQFGVIYNRVSADLKLPIVVIAAETVLNEDNPLASDEGKAPVEQSIESKIVIESDDVSDETPSIDEIHLDSELVNIVEAPTPAAKNIKAKTVKSLPIKKKKGKRKK